MSKNGHIVSTYNQKTVQQKYRGHKKMDCPYLLIDPGRKICRQMTEHGLDGELEDFDVNHYCKGNPNYCFFFRSHNSGTQVTGQLEDEPNVPNLPIVPMTSIMFREPNQLEEPSSKQSDKLLKLKRLLHRIV